MLTTNTFRDRLIAGAAVAVILTLSLSLVGCGNGEGTDKDVTVVATAKSNSTSGVISPPSSVVETAPVISSHEPADSIVTEPAVEMPHEVTYEEAEAAYFDKRYEEAAELFTMYTGRKSRNPWGFYMLGLSAWKAKDYKSAENAFVRALDLDPSHVKSWLNLSRVLLETDRPEEALVKIDEAVAIDPESNVAFRLQGRAFYKLGLLEEAVSAYRQAILLDDQDAWSMNNLGLIFIEEGLMDEALPPLARAVELRDDKAIFQNNLGMALEHLRYFRAAEEAYRSAIAIDGLYEKASANLNRVEAVIQDSDLEQVELTEFAQRFKDEVESWREVATYRERSESVEPDTDSIVYSEGDSTENSHE